MQVTLLALTVTFNYRIILLMLFITTDTSSEPLKTDPSREICTYATWLKPSFAK